MTVQWCDNNTHSTSQTVQQPYMDVYGNICTCGSESRGWLCQTHGNCHLQAPRTPNCPTGHMCMCTSVLLIPIVVENRNISSKNSNKWLSSLVCGHTYWSCILCKQDGRYSVSKYSTEWPLPVVTRSIRGNVAFGLCSHSGYRPPALSFAPTAQTLGVQ